MKRTTLTVALCALVLAGCSRRTGEPAPEVTTTVQHDGLRFLEHLTGGARRDDRVPLIIALHAMDADPADLLELMQGYRGRARILLPYGHPSGGRYQWFSSVGDGLSALAISAETDRLAAAVATWTRSRPTLGKPIVTGFSQGGMVAFSLAVTHPALISAAFPVSGLLPPSLYPPAAPPTAPAASSAAPPARLPPVLAFHGDLDLAVPTQSARDSIAVLQRAGYPATLHTYPSVAHETSAQEVREWLDQMQRVADGLGPAR